MSAITTPEQEIQYSAYMKMFGFQKYKELPQNNKRKFNYIMKNEPRYMINRKWYQKRAKIYDQQKVKWILNSH